MDLRKSKQYKLDQKYVLLCDEDMIDEQLDQDLKEELEMEFHQWHGEQLDYLFNNLTEVMTNE